jgi:hypothetical protein
MNEKILMRGLIVPFSCYAKRKETETDEAYSTCEPDKVF